MLSYLDTAKHAAFGWSAQFGTILTFYICSNFDFVQITCKSGIRFVEVLCYSCEVPCCLREFVLSLRGFVI